MAARAAILRTGLASPVGFGTAQTLAAIAAGVPGFRGSAVMDKRFEELTMALVAEEDLPPLEPAPEEAAAFTARQRRMLRLAAVALVDVLGDDPEAAATPLFLGAPDSVPGGAPVADHAWLAALAELAEVPLAVGESAVLGGGRAAGFAALQAAIDALESGRTRRALVGGVDTFLDLRLLAALDAEGRIQTASEMDGLIPGESAAFVLLGPAADHPDALAIVSAVEIGHEEGHRGSDAPYLGEGLATAVTSALEAAELGAEGVQTIFSGHNGESLGSKEWGVTFARNQAQMNPEAPFVLPAQSVGDCGAAVGPLMLAMAAHGLAEPSVAGPCLVSASADGPERGVAVVQAR